MRINRRALFGLLLVLSTGCAADPPPWTPPAPATSAPQAVQNFLSAVVDGRSGDAASVLSPEATAAGVGRSWLADPPPLTDIRLGDPRPDRAESADEAGYTGITFVPVTFHLDDAEDDFPAGDTAWGYRVGNSADDGWLILSNGPV